MSGIEVAGIALAVFPLVIVALEKYESGIEDIKDWVHFQSEFADFRSAICRERIFFRQNLEELLSPIVESEYEMAQLLDSPGQEAWKDPMLEEGLLARLPGRAEYQSYVTTVQSTLKLMKNLQYIVDGHDGRKTHWTDWISKSKALRVKREFKKMSFTLQKKKREKFMAQLEKHNRSIQELLGNSNRLEPTRKKRQSPVVKHFRAIRRKAEDLHRALTDSWQEHDQHCHPSHALKLLLERRLANDPQDKTLAIDRPLISFKIFYCPEVSAVLDRPLPSKGCNAEVKVVEFCDALVSSEQPTSLPSVVPPWDRPSMSSMRSDTGSARHSQPDYSDGISLATTLSGQGSYMLSTTDVTSSTTKRLDVGERKVSLAKNHWNSKAPWMITDAKEIKDLCRTLRQGDEGLQPSQYFVESGDGACTLRFVDDENLPKPRGHNIVSLKTILEACEMRSIGGDPLSLPRRTRLSLAVLIASSMLQLHAGPWLAESFTKEDIFFLQGIDGAVHTRHPFLIANFGYRNGHRPSCATLQQSLSRSCNASLLSLGILVLELFFGETIESQPFRKGFLGPNGQENEFTNLNTAQKWQDKAMEEAGAPLYTLTRRCIHCAFGAASQDLENEELRKAVLDDVIEPLQKLQAQFEEVR